MKKLLFLLSEVKLLFSTYTKTLYCGNCEREFDVRLKKGHRVSRDQDMSIIHVLVDMPYDQLNPKIYKGRIECPRCGCTSKISILKKEEIHAEGKQGSPAS